MSQTPGIGSSHEDPPLTDPTSFRPSTSRYGTIVQETVLNPEGRRAAGDSSIEFEYDAAPLSRPDSRIVRQLFPADVDAQMEAGEPSAGCELGYFTIEDRIGSGGMGAVFRALDTRLQRVVALKVLAPSQSGDRAAVLRFQNEARAAARLDHENIARVFYFGEDRGLNFIAFEYITGQNVRDLIARTGRLPVDDAVNYTLQIASALRHTAAAGVVHRDIKPSNIIIAPNGRAKLVDLGLARKLAADSVGDLTVAGTTLGTFDYISPEQARDPRNVDVRSDIYSLGCTLYHMLTGGPPYSSGTVLQKLLDHQSGQPPDLRAVNPLVPPALSAVCRKMMAGDPKHRYSTPEELIRDLSQIAAGFGMRPMPAESYVWTRPQPVPAPKVRTGAIWAISAAVVVLLALLVDRLPSTIDASPDESFANTTDEALGLLPGDMPAIEVAAADESEAVAPPPAQPPEPLPFTPIPLADEAGPRVDAADVMVNSGDPSAGSSSSVAAGTTEAPIEAVADARASDVAASPRSSASTPPIATGNVPAPPTLAEIGEVLEATFAPFGEALLGSSDSPPPESMSAPVEDAPASARRYQLTKPFIVWGGAEPQGYDSLVDAIDNAYTGDRIELHFDGRVPGAALTPIRIEDKSITIAAGSADGIPYRPLLEFRGDATSLETRMFVVTGDGAELQIDGVELRMTVSGEARSGSRQWALISLSNAEQVRLTRVGITLVNADKWPLSVFDLRPPEGVPREVVRMMEKMNENRAAGFRVSLENCFVRGQGDLVTIANTLPGRIELRDSAVALGEALLNVTGGLEKAPAGDTVGVTIDHVTAVLGGPVLQVDVDRLPRQVTTLLIEARDSVFAAAREGMYDSASSGPLVLMTGRATPSTFEQALVWTGRRNIFDGYSQFWSVLTEDGPVESSPVTFSRWTERWSDIGPEDPDRAERSIPAEDRMTDIWAGSGGSRRRAWSETTADDLAVDSDDAADLLQTDDPVRIGASPANLPPVTSPSDGLSAAGREARR